MKKIAVLFGGHSSEYEVSLQSAYAVLNAYSALNADSASVMPDTEEGLEKEERLQGGQKAGRWEAVPVGISREGDWYLYEGDLGKIPEDSWRQEPECRPLTLCMNRSQHGFIVWRDGKTELLRVDAAFPVLHGRNGEDGTVQGALELAGIPVIGCGTLASALCMDKELAHRVAAGAGVRVPASVVFSRGECAEGAAEAGKLGYPLFIKPLRAGSSLGITKVTEPEALPAALEYAFAYDGLVVAEEMILGFEVGCAVLEEEGKLLTGEVDEIELSEGFFDFEEKYNLKTSQIHVPARIDAGTAAKIKDTAKRIFRALALSGFARVDMFLTPQGEIYFNEVNTIPGFTEHSRFPGMAAAAGTGFVELIDRLTKNGLA